VRAGEVEELVGNTAVEAVGYIEAEVGMEVEVGGY
jgi:hypothetical protein